MKFYGKKIIYRNLLWSFSGKEFMERRKIEIGERLRREREKAGYSQEAFAEILDCCAVTISRCW